MISFTATARAALAVAAIALAGLFSGPQSASAAGLGNLAAVKSQAGGLAVEKTASLRARFRKAYDEYKNDGTITLPKIDTKKLAGAVGALKKKKPKALGKKTLTKKPKLLKAPKSLKSAKKNVGKKKLSKSKLPKKLKFRNIDTAKLKDKIADRL